MQYQSFIRFLEYCHIAHQDTDTINIGRLKKQAIAEFAMEPTGIITIDGISYNKHDVLTIIESPDFLHHVQFHQLIWQHKGLLHFLEQDKIDLQEAEREWLHLAANEAFVHFVGLYFAGRFNGVLKTLLHKEDLDGATQWMQFLMFVPVYEDEEALKSTRIFMEDSIRLFRNLNDITFKQRSQKLEMWEHKDWYAFFNQLPESLWHYTDELTDAIINFTVRIQKTGKKTCYLLSKQLIQLETVSYNTKQLTRSNHQVYKSNYEKTTWRGRMLKIPSAFYFVMVFIILMKAITTNTCNNEQSGKYQNVAEKLKQQLDKDEVEHFYSFRRSAAYLDSLSSGKNTNAVGSKSFIPFNAPYLYFVISQKDTAKHNKLFPLVLHNKTNQNVPLYMVKSGQILWMDFMPDTYLSLDLAVLNFDFVLGFSNKDNALMLQSDFPLAAQQSFHISNADSKNLKRLVFDDTATVNFQSVEVQKLEQQPLVLTISGQKDSLSFSVKGNVSIARF